MVQYQGYPPKYNTSMQFLSIDVIKALKYIIPLSQLFPMQEKKKRDGHVNDISINPEISFQFLFSL